MKVKREKLLRVLEVASAGTTPREVLEQSDCFVFTKRHLVTFGGEILTVADNPLPGVRGAVPAEDLLGLLRKFPDDEVEVEVVGPELRVRGKRRQAGVTRQEEVRLPYTDIPEPGDWVEPPEEFSSVLLQAARVCGRDDSQPRTTEVHITKRVVEACDNYRLFRQKVRTRLGEEVLVPAASVLLAMSATSFAKVSTTTFGGGVNGWLHLLRKDGHRVSLRCCQGDYPDLKPLLELSSPHEVKLPKDLGDILSRAQVMQESVSDGSVSVRIEDGKLTLRSQKQGGWYEETKGVDYDGEALSFQVNPDFLKEILSHTRKVQVGGNRMRIEAGEATFIVSLEVPKEESKKDSTDDGA